MIQLSVISILLSLVSCGTVDRIGKTAIEEYNFYLNAKKEARAKEIADLVKDDLEEEPTSTPETPKIPNEEKVCKFSFSKLRKVCD